MVKAAVRARKKKELPPNKPWVNKDRTMFGWIEPGPRGEDNLILSMHSCISLAKENVGRIITDEIRAYMV